MCPELSPRKLLSPALIRRFAYPAKSDNKEFCGSTGVVSLSVFDGEPSSAADDSARHLPFISTHPSSHVDGAGAELPAPSSTLKLPPLCIP
jgi:hypothetical protein